MNKSFIKNTANAILATTLLLASANSFAHHDRHFHNNGKQRLNVTSGLSFDSISFNPEAAASALVDDHATGLTFRMDFKEQKRNQPSIKFGMGANLVFFDDNGTFTQTVQDNFGNDIVAQSSADAMHLFIEAGPNLPLGRHAALSLQGGYTLPIHSERDISNCNTCASEEVDIDGGLYGQVGLNFGIDNVNFESKLKVYPQESSDIDSSVSFGISVGY